MQICFTSTPTAGIMPTDQKTTYKVLNNTDSFEVTKTLCPLFLSQKIYKLLIYKSMTWATYLTNLVDLSSMVKKNLTTFSGGFRTRCFCQSCYTTLAKRYSKDFASWYLLVLRMTNSWSEEKAIGVTHKANSHFVASVQQHIIHLWPFSTNSWASAEWSYFIKRSQMNEI